MTPNIEFDYSKLRGRIVEVLGSIGKLAEEMGISIVALSRKLNNKTDFSTCDILLICQILDIPKEEIGSYFYLEKVVE